MSRASWLQKIRNTFGVKTLPGKRHLAMTALGVLAVLSACASAPGGTPSGAAPPSSAEKAAAPSGAAAQGAAPAGAPAVEGGEIQVTLKNHTFPEELRVKAGAKVVFVITNQGDEAHSFEFPDFKVYKEIQPGKTARIEWTVPDKKGKWDMGCFLTDPPGVHDNMTGTLIIE